MNLLKHVVNSLTRMLGLTWMKVEANSPLQSTRTDGGANVNDVGFAQVSSKVLRVPNNVDTHLLWKRS